MINPSLGIKTVAVYSTADKFSLHVKFADEAVCIGPGPSAESYLNIPRIIAAGEITNSDAVHPGYGFLAESADFSRICNDNGFAFIGPSPEIINSMGDKAQAKDTMSKAGVPVIPGSDGLLSSPSEALKLAEEVGYPIMLKATAGGGGKGMRMVETPDDLEKMYTAAQTEAITSFGNGELYLEKFIEKSIPDGARRHRLLGRATMIIFALILVTSTLVYLMLYVIYPKI